MLVSFVVALQSRHLILTTLGRIVDANRAQAVAEQAVSGFHVASVNIH